MATINSQLTTNEFIRLYGDSQYVRDFSPEGIEAVLSEMEEIQEDQTLDWTESFMSAGENDYETFFNEQLDKFDIEDLSCEITDALDGLVEIDDEDTNVIYITSEEKGSRQAYGINDIFKKFTDKLLEDDDFKDTVFNHVNNKQDHRMIQLDNGKVLIFT